MQQIGASTDIRVFMTSNAWCPVTVLEQLMVLIADKPKDSPLLPFPNDPSPQHNSQNIAARYCQT